ncbi:Putative electron transport protein YccM [Pontiella desulfatans]|uniref:Electron transport protein YccM n=1 Tax=Pontiella desulfatans TaxID=2750659 RepID=A0A6C2U3R5_PONDE|nr:4Fe-4S binding protein [Pontiella desulfatans]VGO14477.1 Putative electron transport protein YccM [Pontiella desulfatans]
MIRILLILFLALAPIGATVAQESDECHRPPTQELADYKETYVPQEFHWESFGWEIADVIALAIMLAIGSLLSVRHLQRHWFTALAGIALLYFGIVRGGCICPVGATTNFFMGLAAPELIGKLVAVLFLLPLIAAFFFGRVFCSSACPLGAIQHLLSRKNGIQLPTLLNKILRLIPIALLIATAWGALRSGIFLACKLDVYKPIFFTGHAWFGQLADRVGEGSMEPGLLIVGNLLNWLVLLAVLALGIFIPRPFCRFACPYGVLLGFFSRVGLRKRHIDAESCFACVQCTRTCPVQAITADREKRNIKVSDFHCVQCGRCDVTCKADSFQSPSPYPETRFPNIGKN